MAGFSSGKTKIMADKMQPKIHKKEYLKIFFTVSCSGIFPNCI